MSLPSPDCLPPTSVESITWLVDHTGLKEDAAQTVLTKFRGSRVCALCSFVQGRTSIPFSYIKDKIPKVAVSVTNDIVFEAYCRVHQLVKQSGSPEAACWMQLADSNWDVNAALKILNPTSAAASGETVAVSGPLLNSDFFVRAHEGVTEAARSPRRSPKELRMSVFDRAFVSLAPREGRERKASPME